MKKIKKSVKLNIEGLNGNAYCLIGAFRNQAKREGWTKEEIEQATKEMESGDYHHLIDVLIKYCHT